MILCELVIRTAKKQYMCRLRGGGEEAQGVRR